MRIQSLHDLHLSFPDYDGFWDTQNLLETESRIRARLPFGESAPSIDQFEVLTQAIRLFSLQGKMKEAKDFISYAESVLRDLKLDDGGKLQIRFLLEVGRFYSLSMYPSKATEYFKQAYDLSVKSGKLDYLAIDAAFMNSIALPSKQGKSWFKTALELAEKSDSKSLAYKWRPYLYLYAGWLAFDMYDFNLALSFFDKAETNAEIESRSFNHSLKWSRARVLRLQGKVSEALNIQKALLQVMSQSGEVNGFVFFELAECHQSLQDSEKATEFYELAHEKLKDNKWFSENFSDSLAEILKKSKKKKYQ